MIQEIIILFLFIGALAYIGRLLYKQFQVKSACASGCNKCTVVDFNKIEAELKQRKF
jgi:hypothetical protein